MSKQPDNSYRGDKARLRQQLLSYLPRRPVHLYLYCPHLDQALYWSQDDIPCWKCAAKMVRDNKRLK